MKILITVRVLLSVAGLIAIGIGSALMLIPVEFQASAGIFIDVNNTSLLSEMRSPGGVLFFSGIIMMMGAFKSGITRFALLLSTGIYLGYATGRLISLLADGLPHQSLLIALVIEFIIGGLSIPFLLNYKDPQN